MVVETHGFPRTAGTAQEIAQHVRLGDRDRYVATLFAPANLRDALFALHAYDLALAEVARTTTEPHIGMIRLAWWRDTVRDLRTKPVAGQPVLAALGGTALDPEVLGQLAEAHMDAIDGADLGERGACLFLMAGSLLGGAENESVVEAGRFWAQANALRYGTEVEVALPGPMRFGAVLRPITALAAVARRDAVGKHDPRGSIGRQFAVLRHMLSGRT